MRCFGVRQLAAALFNDINSRGKAAASCRTPKQRMNPPGGNRIQCNVQVRNPVNHIETGEGIAIGSSVSAVGQHTTFVMSAYPRETFVGKRRICIWELHVWGVFFVHAPGD